MLWSMILLSCAREPLVYAPAAPPDPVDEALDLDEAAAPPTPRLDAVAVTAQISTLLTLAAPDPLTVNNTVYAWIMSQGDPSCPGTLSYTTGDCTATTGYRFFGISDYFAEPGPGDDRWVSLALGDMLITDPEGEVMLIGGTYEFFREDDHFTGEVTGTFAYPPLGGWVGEGGSFAWWLEADLTTGSERLQLNGALGAGYGTGLHFDDVVFGGRCGMAPTGALQLRDEVGRWYRLELDEACGGCGQLFYADQVQMGLACVDFGTFFEDTLHQLRAEPIVSVD